MSERAECGEGTEKIERAVRQESTESQEREP
jgi:hypothetical protein